MPYADPDRAAAYNQQRWREHGARYRANRTDIRLPPISRQQALEEDRAQQRVLLELEARRSRKRDRDPAAWLRAWEATERRWIRLTSSRYEIEGSPNGSED